MESSSVIEMASGYVNGTGANYDATRRANQSRGYLDAGTFRLSSIDDKAITGLNNGACDFAEMHTGLRATRMAPGVDAAAHASLDTAISRKEDDGNLARKSAESLLAAKAHEYQTTGLGSVAGELSVWLELVCHEQDDLSVLVLQGSTIRQDFVDLLTWFAPKSGCRGRFGSCCVISDSEDTISQLKHDLSKTDIQLNCQVVDMTIFSRPGHSRGMEIYDIILAPVGIHLGINQLYIFRQLLAPKGHLALVSYCADPYEYIDWKSFVSAAGFYHIAASIDKPGSQLIISSIPTQPDLKQQSSDVVNFDHLISKLSRRLLTAKNK